MSKKSILNKEGQKHYYSDLVTIMQDLNPNEVNDVLYALGLDDLINPDGGVAPYLSADIVSSEERFLNPSLSNRITLTGKLYNYFKEDNDLADSWKWTRDSGNAVEDAVWERNVREIVITDVDLTDKIKYDKVYFHLTVKVGEESFTDTIDFSNLVSLNKVQIEASHSLFLSGDPAEITLKAKLSEGISTSTYKWYVNDVLKDTSNTYKLPSSVVPNGKVANIRLEVIDSKGRLFSDFISIPKISNGSKGEPGVPGPAGNDGRPKYTWIKYADDDMGTDMSEYPVKLDGTFREYMGIATNKDEPTESADYRDYTWSKYIGEDGIPGENGYMWVVYSQFPEGINSAGKVEVSQDTYDEIKGEWMVYLGLAYNKESKTEPNFNGMTETEFRVVDFYWSKIKGEDGRTGYVFDLSNEMHAIPTNSDGKTPSSVAYEGAFTEAYLYYGNDIVPIDNYTVQVEAPFGLVFTQTQITTQGHKFTVTDVDKMADSGVITIKAFNKESTPKLLSSATFSVVKVKSAPAYKLVPDAASIRVVPGVGSSPDVLTPTSLKVKVLRNNGYVVEEVTTGTLTYRYNYQTGDGTPLGINSTLQLSNAGNPTYIQFLYFDAATGMLVDLETVPFVRDGKQGNPGTPGANGQNGAPGVPGSRGPMPRMLEWRENYTYYRSAEYRDYVYFRSSNTAYDGWYCVKDIPINLYNTTPDGVKEYRARGNAGSPDTAIFQKQDFVDSQVFGTIIAENANLAGFIFKDERLVSQTQVGSVPKIILNGKTGYASFIAANIRDSRLNEVEIESAIIENASISNTTFKNGKIEMFSDVVPSNTNKIALSSEVKINAEGSARPTFTFFNNTGDEQGNWETSRSMVQIVGSIYRDGVLFVLPGLPSQSDLTNSGVGGPSFPVGTVYKDSNGFLKIK